MQIRTKGQVKLTENLRLLCCKLNCSQFCILEQQVPSLHRLIGVTTFENVHVRRVIKKYQNWFYSSKSTTLTNLQCWLLRNSSLPLQHNSSSASATFRNTASQFSVNAESAFVTLGFITSAL